MKFHVALSGGEWACLLAHHLFKPIVYSVHTVQSPGYTMVKRCISSYPRLTLYVFKQGLTEYIIAVTVYSDRQ